MPLFWPIMFASLDCRVLNSAHNKARVVVAWLNFKLCSLASEMKQNLGPAEFQHFSDMLKCMCL